jgi:hypothetical protein
LVRTPPGNLPDVGVHVVRGYRGRVHVVDWIDPEAVQMMVEESARLLDTGASVVKVNFGEELPAGGLGPGWRADLPAGTWTGWWTRRRAHGPRWPPAEQGLDTMPLFLREGAVVPLGPVVRRDGERPTDALTVVAAPGRGEPDAPPGVELRP